MIRLPLPVVLLALGACNTRFEGESNVDQDGDGVTPAQGDCDDLDATVSPGAAEIWYDGVDSDCAGDDDFDQDGDGHALGDAERYEGPLPADDCNDEDSSIHGGATDPLGDGVDADCDDLDGTDADGDGYASLASGGTDCMDASPGTGVDPATVHPGAPDTWYDGVDADCSGNDDFDQDRDGHASAEAVAAFEAAGGVYEGSLPEDDCVDDPAGVGPLAGSAIHPGASDAWYDGVDADCNGRDDFDQDGDAFASTVWVAVFEAQGGTYAGALPTTDCVDDPAGLGSTPGALISPGANEVWYDGLDQDCAEDDDFDADGDGHAWPMGVAQYEAGGATYVGLPVDDCNDGDASIHPYAAEVWYDGVDQDCAGDDDFDADTDGFASGAGVEAYVLGGGSYEGELPSTDCDDTPTTGGAIWPGAADTVGDDIDQSCDGIDGIDRDGDGYASEASGGDDCVDTVAGVGGIPGGEINTAAEEVWYDGVDQDCDDANDFDADGDGHAGEEAVATWEANGGTYRGTDPVDDCDEDLPDVNPDADEVCEDGLDNNCDRRPGPCAPDSGLAETSATVTIRGSSDGFGQVVAAIGDVDKDGFHDLMVAEEYRTYLIRGPIPQGEHHITALSPTILLGSPGYESPTEGMVAMHWNCDGILDVVIGRQGLLGESRGVVNVFLGPFPPDAQGRSPDVRYEGLPGDQIGSALAVLPNRRASGCDDLLVGTRRINGSPPTLAEGAVFVIRPGVDLPPDRPDSPALIVHSTRGTSVRVADVVGDDELDIILGVDSKIVAVEGNQAGFYDLAGVSSQVELVASVGLWADYLAPTADIDGDGVVDLAYGPGVNANSGGSGGVISGMDGASLTPGFAGPLHSRFFDALYPVGDLNGDGHQDVAVLYSHNNPPSDHVVYVLYGPDFDAPTLSTPSYRSDNGEFGYWMAGADLTGDGLTDLVVSSGRANNHGGRVYVFAGGRP